jgi:C-terminal processing protease CtpA/Prc
MMEEVLSTVVDIADCSLSKVLLFKLNQQEEKKKFYDRDKKRWDGPLVIMVNSFSAQHQKF